MSFDATDLYAQRWLVNQDILPTLVHQWPARTEGGGYILGNADLHELAPLWGLTVGEIVNEQFYRCDLPKGWGKYPYAENAYWVGVRDVHGRERARIFYRHTLRPKPVLILQRRYMHGFVLEGEDGPVERRRIAPTITDSGKIVWQGAWHEPLTGKKPWIGVDQIDIRAQTELDVLYPDWRNPLAYW